MNNPWILFAVIFIFDAVLALALAGLLARRARATGGQAALIFSLLMLVVWAFCYAMILLTASEAAKFFWFQLQHIGIVGQPVFFFLFALNYTNLNKPIKWPWLAALWVIPSITLILVFSHQAIPLYYTSVEPASNAVGPFTVLRGPFFWLQWLETYVLQIVAAVLLIRWFIANRYLYRWRLGVLVAAVLIPWVAILAYEVAALVNPAFSFPINISPVTLTLSAGAIGAILFGFHQLDLLPIARDVVMEHIPEMVVVVDAHDRVLDANHVARQWLGKSLRDIVGGDPLDVFHKWPQLVNRFLMTNETQEEIQVEDPPRTLELIVTPIYNHERQLQGRVIVAHDITDRKLMEGRLAEANATLRTQLAEIESLRAKLEEQAIRDPLTGAYNRRFFAESLDREVARATRDGHPFTIVIMDVDHFKRFNDTYGHRCGDVMLQAMTHFLMERTRSGDIVCRYGGEEFVVLMPNANLEMAGKRVETWRQEFEQLVVEFNQNKMKATFSAGAATFTSPSQTGDHLLHMADQALYHSKNTGRNRVTLFHEALETTLFTPSEKNEPEMNEDNR